MTPKWLPVSALIVSDAWLGAAWEPSERTVGCRSTYTHVPTAAVVHVPTTLVVHVPTAPVVHVPTAPIMGCHHGTVE